MHDRTNVRALTPDDIGGPVELTVADLSFISLRLVLPALAACTADDGDLLPMVKPQFEVGRERLGSGGSSATRRCAPTRCSRSPRAAGELGWRPAGVCAQPAARAVRATWNSSCGCGASRVSSALGADADPATIVETATEVSAR